MKVAVIGTGYVGLVSGTCFAHLGHDVTCIDIDPKKIEMLNKLKSPIYEPGLTEIIESSVKNKKLFFSTNFEAVKTADVIFLAVGTPPADDGRANLSYLKSAAAEVAKLVKGGAAIVIKSTVPVATHLEIQKLVGEITTTPCYVVNNPEFLKEGSAVDDFLKPDRILIGSDKKEAFQLLRELYRPLIDSGAKFIEMSNLSAEMSKYAANCFLATKISFINEIARLCDATGADINEVRNGIASDQRIGPHFLNPGPGYGGSCFPKDVQALMKTANDFGMNLKMIEATELVNEEQKVYLFSKMNKYFKSDFKDRKITFWGAAFKANTDDVRESSAISLAKKLIDVGAHIQIFDPVAMDNYLKEMGPYEKKVKVYSDMYSALVDSSALVIMTEWDEFKQADLEKISVPVIFDGRNLFDGKQIQSMGKVYYSIGKRL